MFLAPRRQVPKVCGRVPLTWQMEGRPPNKNDLIYVLEILMVWLGLFLSYDSAFSGLRCLIISIWMFQKNVAVPYCKRTNHLDVAVILAHKPPQQRCCSPMVALWDGFWRWVCHIVVFIFHPPYESQSIVRSSIFDDRSLSCHSIVGYIPVKFPW